MNTDKTNNPKIMEASSLPASYPCQSVFICGNLMKEMDNANRITNRTI